MIKSAALLIGLAVAVRGQFGQQHQGGAPQYGAQQQQAAPGPLFSFSNSVSHTPAQQQPGATGPGAAGHYGGGYGASYPASAGQGPVGPSSYAAPRPQAPSYATQPAPVAAPQRGYSLPNLEQLGAHNPASVQGFGDLNQLAQQNPAFNIPFPRGQEQHAANAVGAPGASAGYAGFQAAPAPAAVAYRASPQYGSSQFGSPQYGASQQGAPQYAVQRGFGAGPQQASNPYGGPFQYSSSVSHAAPQTQYSGAAGAAPATQGRY